MMLEMEKKRLKNEKPSDLEEVRKYNMLIFQHKYVLNLFMLYL